MAIEIVDMVIFHGYVKLPEGNIGIEQTSGDGDFSSHPGLALLRPSRQTKHLEMGTLSHTRWCPPSYKLVYNPQ